MYINVVIPLIGGFILLGIAIIFAKTYFSKSSSAHEIDNSSNETKRSKDEEQDLRMELAKKNALLMKSDQEIANLKSEIKLLNEKAQQGSGSDQKGQGEARRLAMQLEDANNEIKKLEDQLKGLKRIESDLEWLEKATAVQRETADDLSGRLEQYKKKIDQLKEKLKENETLATKSSVNKALTK